MPAQLTLEMQSVLERFAARRLEPPNSQSSFNPQNQGVGNMPDRDLKPQL